MSVSKIEVFSSNLNTPASFIWDFRFWIWDSFVGNGFSFSYLAVRLNFYRSKATVLGRSKSEIQNPKSKIQNPLGNVAQSDLARLRAKEQVGGSSPSVLIKYFLRLRSSTDLERKNSTLEVAGSNPAGALSILDFRFRISDFFHPDP